MSTQVMSNQAQLSVALAVEPSQNVLTGECRDLLNRTAEEACAAIDAGAYDLMREINQGQSILVEWLTVSGDCGRRNFKADEWVNAHQFAAKLSANASVYHSWVIPA